MSVKVSTAVFELSVSEGAARLVMLALADVAGDDGEVSAYNRSHTALAAKANVSVPTVARVIKSLVAMGELEVISTGSGRERSNYRITLDTEGAPPISSPPHQQGDSGAGGVTLSTQPPQEQGGRPPHAEGAAPSAAGGPSLHPLTSPSIPCPSRSFDEFWQIYPKKVSKGAASKRWKAATRTTDPAVIIAGAERYAAETAGSHKRFIKDPAGWLNAERWLDEPGANVRSEEPAGARRRIAEDHGPDGIVPKEAL